MERGLLKLLREKEVPIGVFARSIGLTHQSLIRKAKGEYEFKASEILKISNKLNLSFDEVNGLFFKGELNASLHNKV